MHFYAVNRFLGGNALKLYCYYIFGLLKRVNFWGGMLEIRKAGRVRARIL
jgi:hypothetical protein